MSKIRNEYEEELYSEEYEGGYLPHDTIGEMEYHAKKQKSESNAVNVAKAVLVVACIGLICAIIDYYIEQI